MIAPNPACAWLAAFCDHHQLLYERDTAISSIGFLKSAG